MLRIVESRLNQHMRGRHVDETLASISGNDMIRTQTLAANAWIFLGRSDARPPLFVKSEAVCRRGSADLRLVAGIFALMRLLVNNSLRLV